MSAPGTGKKIASIEHQHDDDVEYRKRVATYVDGNTVSYEDTSFTTGDSPAVLDVFTDLGRIAHEGYVVNDGPGDITIEFSFDGATYGGLHTLKDGEMLSFNNLKIKRIRLTWIDNSAYRVMVA
jgi:hypothetical protein